MVALAYHRQIRGQVEVSNREIKQILEKSMNTSQNDWAYKLDDSVWVHQSAHKIPIPMEISSYRLVYEKSRSLTNRVQAQCWL